MIDTSIREPVETNVTVAFMTTDESASLVRAPDWLSIAERIARQAHAGQKEESTGDDYIHHVARVVAMVEGDNAKAVAWLHDVIEDSDVSYSELRRAGIPATVVDAVRLVTREDPYEYAPYIEQIRASGNDLALVVKLADLRDHLRPNCPERLRPRYEKALATLTAPATRDEATVPHSAGN